MKLLRISVLVIFVLSSISYAWYKTYESRKLDTIGPEITYQGDSISVSVSATEDDLLTDVKAFDQEDGDVSNTIIIEKISKIALGKRNITYAAFDSSNNITMVNRDLIYKDYSPPRFSLTKPLIFDVGEFDNILKNIKVTDCIDGDISDKIKFELPEAYFFETVGQYDIKFLATNSIGDTAILPAKVEFKYPNLDSKDKVPQIILKEYLIYHKVGAPFNAMDYIDKVKIGQKEYNLQEKQPVTASGSAISQKGISLNSISVQSDIDPNKSGVYEVNYFMTAPNGYQGSTKLLVIVEE